MENTTNEVTIAQMLISIRLHKKMNQKELAEYLNVSAPAISYWESNLRSPSLLERSKIIKEYKSLPEDAKALYKELEV